MLSSIRRIFVRSEEDLTPAQRRIYDEELFINWRGIARLCATRSSHTLTSADLASRTLRVKLAQFGQFAELACIAQKRVNAQSVLENVHLFTQDGFPFSGYDALRDATLVSSFFGTVAQPHVLLTYRTSTKQLIIGFQATTNLEQLMHDFNAVKQAHPAGPRCRVHKGFWKLYQGCRAQAFEGVRHGLRKRRVRELVSVGHSMGAALAHLFALDVLSSETSLKPGLAVTIATFGCPRFGNAALVDRWQEILENYRTLNGKDSVHEYTVRAFNDGVVCLPPTSLGYKHLTRTPLYYYHGRLFHVPASESKHLVFTVSEDALDTTKRPDFPRGGHNYYNGRNQEKMARRVGWLERIMENHESGWRDKYIAYLVRHDPEWHAKAVQRRK